MGDSCKYLSKTKSVSGSWRMPTAEKFNAASVVDNGSVACTIVTTPWAKLGDLLYPAMHRDESNSEWWYLCG
ncbi:hypothetical protein [uncultured Bacteroides sp.]|uniref:hypothetical protein n=1 Tax=uncultured Bacteroides sp. TaxID=162156 RepID=UPI002AAA7FF4|nr:hypothetical protein [uncultured Bacteroides sp.]